MDWEKPKLHDFENENGLIAQGQCADGTGDNTSCNTGGGADTVCATGNGPQGNPCANGVGVT